MKHLCVVIFLSISLLSCSEETAKDIQEQLETPTDNVDQETEDDTTSTDPIIGTWSLSKQNGFNVPECDSKTTYVFTDDEKYTYTQFGVNTENQCEENTATNATKGHWKNNDDETYHLRRHGYNTGSDVSILFEDDNKTMTLGKFTYSKK